MWILDSDREAGTLSSLRPTRAQARPAAQCSPARSPSSLQLYLLAKVCSPRTPILTVMSYSKSHTTPDPRTDDARRIALASVLLLFAHRVFFVIYHCTDRVAELLPLGAITWRVCWTFCVLPFASGPRVSRFGVVCFSYLYRYD
jgi:hypothetical protein